MAKRSKLEKIVIATILLCVLVLIYLGCCALVFFRKKDIPIAISNMHKYNIALDLLYKEYNKEPCLFSDEEFREIIEDETGLSFYIYFERNLGDEYSGLTLSTIRTIIVDERVKGYDYCEVFMHEAIHLTHFTGNERYVSFNTFKYLYESEKLHDVGVRYGIRQIHGYYNGEYDVYDLIIDYLTKE